MKVKRNIVKLIDQIEDVDMVNGLDWYKNARVYCYKLSLKYDVPYIKVCGVMAALSPRNKWERNKIDTENLIRFYLGLTKKRPLFGTYSKMVEKAIDIMDIGYNINYIRRTLNGPKITAFFNNIYDTDNSDVTVDTWMHLAALGKYMSIDERPSLKKKDYQEIETVIKELAIDVQLRPYELQAVLWCTIKRLNGPAGKDQK